MDDKKIPGKRRRRCKYCKQLKYGVIKTINPYEQDVNSLEIIEILCPGCIEILKNDI